MLLGVGFACGMSLPKFEPRRVVVIRFVRKVRLVGEIVPDIEKVPETNHAFVRLINVPIVLGKNVITNGDLGVLENRYETDTLDTFVFLGPSQFQYCCTNIYTTD